MTTNEWANNLSHLQKKQLVTMDGTPQHSTPSRNPCDYGIQLWLDEGGRLFATDPSRFRFQRKHSQPIPAQPFMIPIGNGAIYFEYRITLRATRVFEATSILTETELANNPVALWSDVLGLHQEAG